MNLFKKVVATIATTAVLVSTTAVSSVSAYTTDSYKAAQTLAEKGIVVAKDSAAGYELGRTMLRQELAAMALAVAKLPKKATCDNEYEDVSATKPNTWACYVVEALRDNGILAKNAKFNPERNVTKAEALGMIVGASNLGYKYDATKGTSWQEQLVNFAVNNNILPAAFTDYNAPATRGWVFKTTVDTISAVSDADMDNTDDLLNGLLNGEDENTDNGNSSNNTDNNNSSTNNSTVTTSDLKVELNPESPAGSDLPKGADGVEVLKLDLTAGNSDVTVTELNFERTGFGQDAADKISLYANGQRLTKSKKFNSDDEANVSISPALVVKAGETVTVDVRVDTSNTYTGEFAVKLTGVTASTEVNASEIVSNTFEVKNVEATELDFQTGSVNSQVTAGDLQDDVMEFDLKNKGNVNNSDVTVKSITLKEVGSIDQTQDLANLTLVHNGKVLATVASMNNKYVTFNLSTPVVVKENQTETFKVKADITGGADKTIKFVLDTDGDIVATASKYNAVNVVNEFSGQEITVQAGELTLYAIDAQNDKVRDDTDNVVLGQLKVVNVAGQDLNIKNLGFKIETTNSGVLQVLENVKAEINGTSYDLYADTTDASAQSVVFSDTDLDITLPQGTTVITLMADTLDNLTDGTEIKPSLTVNNTEFYVEENEDDTQVTDITPSSLTWNDVEIKQPQATVSKTPLANVAVVKGTSDVVALQYDVESNEVSPLTIDKVKVNVNYAGGYGSAVKDYVTAVALYKGSVSDANKLDSISGTRIGSNGDVTFDGFEVTVPANQTETFIVTVSTADSDDAINGVVTTKLVSLNVKDDKNDLVTTDPTDLTTITGRDITIKDSGKLSLNVATSADNDDNQDDKTILAGTAQTVFSVDTKATNEEINIERIKFVVSGADVNKLKDTIKEAKLYLGDKLVATTPNSRVIINGSDVEIYFKDMTNTVIPTTSSELKLGIATENIGYEKVGKAFSGAKVTAIKLDENYVKGVESNEKVDLNNDNTIDEATTDVSSVAKEFAVVPAVVTPSVTDTFGTDDLNANVTMAVDTGDNTDSTDGSALVAKLKAIKVEVSSLTQTGTLTLFNGNGDQIATADVTSAGTVTINVSGNEYISDNESYRLETTAQASFRLAKDGVTYNVDNADYTTNLDNTQDLGTYKSS